MAVTRARSELVVYCSFGPEEMRLKENGSKGLQLLRTYLMDARDGNARSGDLIGRAPTAPDHHRSEIAGALRVRGLRFARTSASPTFGSIWQLDDLPMTTGQLPFCWTGLAGPRSTVYDRDALPASVLHGAMGWRRVERVWFPMWLNPRDEVLADIERAVELPLNPPDVDAHPQVEPTLPPDPSNEERLRPAEEAGTSMPEVRGPATTALAAPWFSQSAFEAEASSRSQLG